jgi:hypothetical protein
VEKRPRLTSTDTLSVVALPQQPVDTTDGERETGLGRTPEMRVSLESRSEMEGGSGRLD